MNAATGVLILVLAVAFLTMVRLNLRAMAGWRRANHLIGELLETVKSSTDTLTQTTDSLKKMNDEVDRLLAEKRAAWGISEEARQ